MKRLHTIDLTIHARDHAEANELLEKILWMLEGRPGIEVTDVAKAKRAQRVDLAEPIHVDPATGEVTDSDTAKQGAIQ